MKRYCSLLFAMIALVVQANAQSLSPSVIASGGGFSANGTAMLSFTTGELTMVETFSAGSSILTQGFQQPEDFSTGISVVTAQGPGMSAFPNPATDAINLLSDFTEAGRLRLLLTDALGRIVLQGDELEIPGGTSRITQDVSRVASGVYFVHAVFQTHSGKATASIQKITIQH